MKGEQYLKPTGIIMIIGGILGIILGIMTIIRISNLPTGYVIEGDPTILYISLGFAIFCSIFEIITGIVGFKNCKDPYKAGLCLVLGIIMVVMSLTSQIFSVVIGGGINIIYILTGLVLPVLYIIGAVMNKKEITQ